jgi:hypothetical protein
MKHHTKIYLDYFGYSGYEFMPCEIPSCERCAVDVCHIDARGMGGNPSGSKDIIENLMGKCRKHHDEFGDKKEFKEWLKQVHLAFMKKNKV